MFDLFKSDQPSLGIVMFRGNVPTRAEEFEFLTRLRIDVQPDHDVDQTRTRWALKLRHPAWGTARLWCPTEPPPPCEHADFSPFLTDRERAAIKASRSAVLVRVSAQQKTVLRDRKNLLRFLGAIMGDDGVAATDVQSMLIWTREALDEELAHDADLDVQALFCLHAITDDTTDEQAEPDPDGNRPKRCTWLHSHGLAELGAFDFDFVFPSADVARNGDIHRSLAFAIIEGEVKPATERFEFAHPGGTIRMVPSTEFMRQAEAKYRQAREMGDDSHEHKRSVACEPTPGRLLGLLGGKRLRPSSFLSRPLPEQLVVRFSTAATELMARRARDTASLFERLTGELAEFDVQPIAKMWYETDGGENGRIGSATEHLWFEVHGFRPGEVDATLLNDPFDIAGMKAGDRQWRPLERLSDWTIFTPAGQITPRSLWPARALRQSSDDVLAS